MGYGFSGRRIAGPLLASVPEFEVSAVVARSEEMQALAAAEHPNAIILSSMEELIARRASLDLVVIGTPDDSHFALAAQALDAQLNVVVDKPLATASPAAIDLVALAETNGVVLTAFQNKRWDSDFLTVRNIVDSGVIGDLIRYEAWIARWSPDVTSSWRDQARPGQLDGRLADLGSHLVDQAVALLGPVSRVYAELDQRRPAAHTNDDVFLALTHDNGIRTHLHMGAVTSHPTPTFEVQGLAGSFTTRGLDGQFAALAHGVGPQDPEWRDYDTWSGELIVNSTPEPFPIAPGDWRDFYHNLARTLRDGSALAVQPATVVHVLMILEAALESHRTQSVVSLR